eukprot:4039701-Amphidinium_carterae.1
MATLQPWSIKLLAREINCFTSMDTQREAHLLASHHTARGEDRQLDPSPALFSEDAPTEESAML